MQRFTRMQPEEVEQSPMYHVSEFLENARTLRQVLSTAYFALHPDGPALFDCYARQLLALPIRRLRGTSFQLDPLRLSLPDLAATPLPPPGRYPRWDVASHIHAILQPVTDSLYSLGTNVLSLFSLDTCRICRAC
jgi:hypothetical protein